MTILNNANISASYGEATISTAVTVVPESVLSVKVNPSAVVGGNNVVGTVTLAGPTTVTTQVQLASSSSIASIFPTVEITAGSTSGNFTIRTQIVQSSQSATISASYGGVAQTCNLSVIPLSVSSLTLNPTSVLGGLQSQGTVTLNGPAPASTVVNLASNSTTASVPKTVTVALNATTATFLITSIGSKTSSTAAISATFGGSTATATLTINPIAVTGLTLTPNPLTCGTACVGEVKLSGLAPKGGLIVKLTNSSKVVTMPQQVTVAEGLSTATFKISTTMVSAKTTSQMTASLDGTTVAATLTIVPPVLASVTLASSEVASGRATTGVVALTGPAPAGGVKVLVTSTSKAVHVPQWVTIPAGATKALFSVKTDVFFTPTTTAIITASVDLLDVTTKLTVDADVLSMKINPTYIFRNGGATGTVCITTPAITTLVIHLSTSNPLQSVVHSTVTLYPGNTQADFEIMTFNVQVSVTITITATL